VGSNVGPRVGSMVGTIVGVRVGISVGWKRWRVGDARKTQVSFVERARSIFIKLYSQKV